MLAIIGESGCGKTTLARMLLRLIEPDSGEILFAGRNLLELGVEELRAALREMQMVFQDPFASLNRVCVWVKSSRSLVPSMGANSPKSRPRTKSRRNF